MAQPGRNQFQGDQRKQEISVTPVQAIQGVPALESPFDSLKDPRFNIANPFERPVPAFKASESPPDNDKILKKTSEPYSKRTSDKPDTGLQNHKTASALLERSTRKQSTQTPTSKELVQTQTISQNSEIVGQLHGSSDLIRNTKVRKPSTTPRQGQENSRPNSSFNDSKDVLNNSSSKPKPEQPSALKKLISKLFGKITPDTSDQAIPPKLAFFTKFKGACSQTPKSSRDRSIIAWNHSCESFNFVQNKYQTLGKLTNQQLMREVENLKSEPGWDPVKNYSKALLGFIVWLLLIIVVAPLLISYDDAWGINIGSAWPVIGGSCICIVFAFIFNICALLEANRLSSEKVTRLVRKLDQVENKYLKGTDIGLRCGKEGSWIEIGNTKHLCTPSSVNLSKLLQLLARKLASRC